ncbi:hypothetical protein FHU36_005463 [Nonomuraea muscovyensis]|uniref:CU044_5270 family protein n=1 Tax=Nonomuraea muscovyensis TaxID=1124761 RepID=A0A7X0EYP3_9ACTN|nr:hypothetical protein [Nonomuraea muscovyensis]MBB6348918.1 hypothetical protein [Nonomuraea muscovyensis]
MDELERVRELYGEPPRPDPAFEARVRARLAGRSTRRRRLSWAVPLAGAVASLAAVLITYGVVGGAGTVRDPGPGVAAGRDPAAGRSVLLTAATSAAAEATPRGAYWRVTRRSDPGKVTTLWASRDGRAWTAGPATGTAPRPVAKPFTMAGRPLTLRDIEGLPAEPGALKRRVAALLPPGSGDGTLADAVSGLLWSKPSPPAVRAAAYRLLADLPNVRYLGPGDDPTGRRGQVFAFTLDATGVERILTVDPASSQVLSSADHAAGGKHARGGGGAGTPANRVEVVLTAGWTDEGPATP